MGEDNGMSLFGRLYAAVLVTVFALVVAVLGEAVDHYVWGLGLVDADTFAEYLTKTRWFFVAVGVFAFLMGLWKGIEAVDRFFPERNPFWWRAR